MITINDPRFGDNQTFDTLDEAQDAIRACGYPAMLIADHCGRVMDDHGNVIGFATPDATTHRK